MVQRIRLLGKFEFWVMLLGLTLLSPVLSKAAVTPVSGTIATDFTFQEGETYSVTGPVTMTGATTFEGGATIKFDSIGSLNVSDPSFKTTFSNQITFTSKDDDSVGEVVTGSTGSPSSYPNALTLAKGSARFVQIRYADEGVVFTGNETLTVRDSEFFAVGTPVNASSSSGPATVNLNNLLIANGTNGPALADDGTNALTVNANNITLTNLTGDGFSNTITAAGSSLNITDSLFVDIQGASMFAGTAPTTENYNAFFHTADTGNGANNVTLTTDPILTDFFLDQTSPIINAGSQSATAAGMYHYNTNSDGTIEGPTTVDIGYHASPSISQFSILALKSIWMKSGSMVSGDIAVNQATAGPFLDSNVALSVGHDMVLPPAINLRADSIKVKTGAIVNGKVYHNQLENNGAINGTSPTPLAFPILDELPLFRAATLGTVSDIIVVSGTTHVLAPGDYGIITVNDNATLQFTGGLYQIQKIDAKVSTSLLFDAPSEVRIKENLKTKRLSTLTASAGATLNAGDIRFFVEGADVGTTLAVEFGHTHTVKGHFYAPNGTLSLKRQSTFSGIFLAKDVMIGHDSQVELDEGSGQPIVATPSIIPNGGTFNGAVDVSLSTITSGATIHFTTDGTTPTSASPTFSTPITLSPNAVTQTIKAIGLRFGFTDSSVASADFTVNDPPVAVFTATPTTGEVPLTVNFDASASTDPGNNITAYTWDFGDGTTGTGVTASHEYTAGGTVTVTLTVTNGMGATGQATTDIVINAPPVAAFTPISAEGRVPLTVSFDASTSTDVNNDITSYEWDFGDGATATGVTAIHEYTNSGTFAVSLTVTDALGLVGTSGGVVSVIPTNTPPTAEFTHTAPGPAPAPFTVSFDASGSTDDENNIATYSWDFGDGSTDSGITTTHEYTTVGVFSVVLTVTDDLGLSDQFTSVVETTGNKPPAISISSPSANASIIESRPEIRLAYSDDTAVDTTSLSLFLNGAPLTATCNFDFILGTCALSQDLPEGSVTLSASISDLEGETTSATSTFFVDGVPVEVAIIAPVDRAVTQDDSVVVTGAIGTTVDSIEVNGVPATVTGLNFSATIPLREGKNMLIATARNLNGKTGVSSVDVTRDIKKPIVRINSPRDGFPAVENRVTVTGIINDTVDGGVAPTVKINGIEVPVVNGTFIGVDLELGLGPNTIEAVATDAAGNAGNHSITVNFQPPAGPKLIVSSGNGQQVQVGSSLTDPLVVQVVDGEGLPVAGRTVRFEVTRNDGTLSGSGMVVSNRIVGVITDGNGQAKVNLTLGDTAGGGNNRVRATSPGVAGEVEFCATGLPNPPDQIIAVMGDNQRGSVGQPLPIPLEALAVDPRGNPVGGVGITFDVVQGAGTLNGQSSVVVTTGSDGIARTVLNLGQESGVNNNVVEATFLGLTNLAASFTASGIVPGDPANTTFSGVVLDSAETPVVEATVSILGTAISGLTDDEGQFLLTGVPVGEVALFIDPFSSPTPIALPTLEFITATVAGVENTLGHKIILPPVDIANAKVVGGTEDVTLEMEGVPGASITILANSVTFPDGSNTGFMWFSQVHLDQVPMQPPDGTFPALMATLQPPGVHFDPPARITIPNVSGLPPGAIGDIFSFDHDLFTFVDVGRGTVSEDGLSMVSDPGFGIESSGWVGCGGRQNQNCNRGEQPLCHLPSNRSCSWVVSDAASVPQKPNDCMVTYCNRGGVESVFNPEDVQQIPEDCKERTCEQLPSPGGVVEIAKDDDKPNQQGDECKFCRDKKILDYNTEPLQTLGSSPKVASSINVIKDLVSIYQDKVNNLFGLPKDTVSLSTTLGLDFKVEGRTCCVEGDGALIGKTTNDGYVKSFATATAGISAEVRVFPGIGKPDIERESQSKIHLDADKLSVTRSKVKFGVFITGGGGVELQGGDLVDRCDSPPEGKSCTYASFDFVGNIGLIPKISFQECVKTDFSTGATSSCVGFNLGALGATVSISGGLGLNRNKCDEGVSGNLVLGKTDLVLFDFSAFASRGEQQSSINWNLSGTIFEGGVFDF
jgi:PKD repeat protein